MKDFFNCVMDIGEQMLICGAEVHRVEDSIERMCRSFGAQRTDVFIITSNMDVTVYYGDGESCTQTRRITWSGSNFEKLHRLNALSRRICSTPMTVEQVREELDAIAFVKTYPFWVECLCYAMIAGAFTVFFGGSYIEGLVSFVIGALVRLVIRGADLVVSNKLFSRFIASFTATGLAFGAVKLGWIPNVDMIMIGNIMTLIPGVGLTNALRDLFTGDSIAGLLRSIEAVLIALAIAAGYFLFVAIGGVVG